MIYFRVDANETIATGHVMRCISVAKELEKLGEKVAFITSEKMAEELLIKNNLDMISLNTVWNDMEAELPQLLQLLSPEDKLVVDSYYVTPEYFQTLSGKVKVIYFDDLDKFKYDCKMLINYNYYGFDMSYSSDANKGQRLLLGPAYAPLREQFRNLKKNARDSKSRILILSGGVGNRPFLQTLMNEWRKDKSFSHNEYWIIVGKGNPYIEEIRADFREMKEVTVRYGVENMAELMLEANLAVSAGGTTLYELCACGVPTIAYQAADNQKRNIQKFVESQLMEFAGNIVDGKKLFREIIAKSKALLEQPEKQREISLRMMQMVDGYGSLRIAEEIKTM